MPEQMEQDVLMRKEGAAGILKLNRPKALHALTLNMVRLMTPQLLEWRTASDLGCVIVESDGEKAFCAGGDIRALYDAAQAKNTTYLQEFYGEEYQLNRLIKTYSKPYIALLDGITMGGGVGISVHGDFRVATENTLFAMPETGIGFFPDVGGTYFLPRLPGKIGMYLALTGARLKAADMIFAGLATHYVPSARLPEVQQALAAMPVGHGKSDAVAAVNAILNMYHEDPDKSLLRENYDAINQHFSGHSVEEIVENLRASTTDFAQKTLKILLQKSPSALKVTYRQMQVGAILDFDRAMQLEYRLACGIACDADFAEGVRAVIVDKDQNPKWSPGQLSDVSAAYVDQYFDVLGTPDLTFTAVDG